MKLNVEKALQVQAYLRRSFEESAYREAKLRFEVKHLSKAVKCCHYILSSPELGYKRIEHEYQA